MKTVLEITRKEFMNLKNGTDEGYSELDGFFCCRLGKDKSIQQDQVDEVRKGNGNTVFFMRVAGYPVNQQSLVESSRTINLVVVQAQLVEEHAKEIDRDLESGLGDFRFHHCSSNENSSK